MKRNARAALRVLPPLLIAAILSASPASGRSHYTPTTKDLMSIQAMFDRYFQGSDKLDSPLMASAFAEDGLLSHTLNGKTLETLAGRKAIRERRPPPGGAPKFDLWHLMTNSRLDFQSPTHATHYAYWMDIKVSPEGAASVGIPGHFEDVLVKRKGEWLIEERRVFIGTK